jgi:NAD(P)-dependent dehydrogenase (short-subunit alcohol dehydrogenase family)
MGRDVQPVSTASQAQATAAARTAFVTGAAQGLGAAIALRLAREGYDVAISDPDPARLHVSAQAIEALGRRAYAVGLDLREQAGIEAAFAGAVAALGEIQVLVNNAGVTLRRSAVDVTRAEWNEVIGVMLAGTFFMSQQLGRHRIARGAPGAIVSLASTHGLVGLADRSTYGIAKGGIIQMTRMLAIEWARHGIRVNAIAPGTVETPSRKAHFDADPPARERMLARIPSGRFGLPQEVAGAVAYLASDDAAYVTGQTLVLDGGLTAA